MLFTLDVTVSFRNVFFSGLVSESKNVGKFNNFTVSGTDFKE